MNDLQKRLWDWMIELVREYNQREISFHQLVQDLKRCEETAGFQDANLVDAWNGVWSSLAEFDAKNSPEENPHPMEVQPSVEKMRSFLLDWKGLSGPRGWAARKAENRKQN